ncbi:MAG: NAD(+)/NADH kinase [Oscillospiraceae bacterium]|nr:NAD(+)/NADH kinase [Oscillospiraceae bacterium]
MKKVLLNPNPSRDIGLECTKKVSEFFKQNGVSVFISEEIPDAATCGATLCDFESVSKEVDAIISFGGDGTLLDTANQVCDLDVPILGINIGRIGYMAELESHELNYLQNIIDGNFKVEERMMIDVSVVRDGTEIYTGVALNDVVVMKTGLIWTIDMDIYADNMFISRYSGDGVIFATPTGSTAYSLSAGGPIIDPSSKNITITPVCAHALTAKPIVLSSDRVIKIVPQNAQNRAVSVSLDGNEGIEVKSGDCFFIKKSRRTTKLIHVKDTNFYDVLYTKLSDRRYS